MDQEKTNPLDLDGDQKISPQETAIAIAFIVVAAGLLAYFLYLVSAGQITQDTINTLIAITAAVAGREGYNRIKRK